MIAGDIQDQIQSIGVLEALGYTSKKIALFYTAEHLMTALAVLPLSISFLYLTLRFYKIDETANKTYFPDIDSEERTVFNAEDGGIDVVLEFNGDFNRDKFTN